MVFCNAIFFTLLKLIKRFFCKTNTILNFIIYFLYKKHEFCEQRVYSVMQTLLLQKNQKLKCIVLFFYPKNVLLNKTKLLRY